ncbi:MAG: hypothetical protein KA436_08075 [Oligoflexales bacterium]|nr:hypothetical protein [Oligoflexales bacterium]
MKKNSEFDYEKAYHQVKEQLHQKQRLDSINALAGGIFHEFNNILCTLQGYTELLVEKLQGFPEQELLIEMFRSGEKARKLLSCLLRYEYRSEPSIEELNLAHVVQQSVEMLRLAIPKTIRIQESYPVEKILVRGDRSQISQVLVNLAINSYHAIKQKGECGQISISLEQDKVKEPAPPDITRYAHLTVSDNGVGVPKNMTEHVFNAFFTSNNPEQYSGLGMSVAKTITEEYGGNIDLESEEGKGTSVAVHLPLIL